MAVFEKKCPNSNQLKSARALLGWGQLMCADIIKVSVSSIRRYEALPPLENPYDHLRSNVIERIVLGLERHGIDFINDQTSIGSILSNNRERN